MRKMTQILDVPFDALTNIVDFTVNPVEHGIADHGFSAQDQLPAVRNPHRKIGKGLRIVGDDFADLAVSSGHGLHKKNLESPSFT